MRYCPACGAQVEESSQFCNTCGYNMNEQAQSTYQTANYNNTPISTTSTSSNGMAIAGFVVSLVSLFLCCGCISIVGLILSCIGLKRAKQNNGAGQGLGIAGLIINILGILLSLFWLFIAIFPLFITMVEVM